MYLRVVAKCKKTVPMIIDSIPPEWDVEKTLLERKLQELFAVEWINDTWFNFKDLVEKA